MRAPDHLAAILTHECGARLQVAFVDIERPYTCPGCGVIDRIGADTMPGLLANFGRALDEARRRSEAGGGMVRVRLDCHTGAISEGVAHG